MCCHNVVNIKATKANVIKSLTNQSNRDNNGFVIQW